MKTPEQIAEEAMRSDDGLGDIIYANKLENDEVGAIYDAIVAAIKADRAQRRLVMLIGPGTRVWTETPADVLRQINEALDVGYTMEEMRFEQ